MTTHTPGPWHIDGDRGVIYGVAPMDNGELPICELLHDNDVDSDRCAEDAKLIAAAPETAAERDRLRTINAELLAALELLLVQKPYRDGDGAAMYHAENIAKSAIAKAKGEQS